MFTHTTDWTHSAMASTPYSGVQSGGPQNGGTHNDHPDEKDTWFGPAALAVGLGLMALLPEDARLLVFSLGLALVGAGGLVWYLGGRHLARGMAEAYRARKAQSRAVVMITSPLGAFGTPI